MEAVPPEFADLPPDENPWRPSWKWPVGEREAERQLEGAASVSDARSGTGKYFNQWAADNIVEKLSILAHAKILREGGGTIDFSMYDTIKLFLLPEGPPTSPPTSPPDEDVKAQGFAAYVAGQIMQMVFMTPDDTGASTELWRFRKRKLVRVDRLPLQLRTRAAYVNPRKQIVTAQISKGILEAVFAPGWCLDNLVKYGYTPLFIEGFNHALILQFNETEKLEVWDPNLDGVQFYEAAAYKRIHKTPDPVGWCALWAAYHIECILAGKPSGALADDGDRLVWLKNEIGSRYVNVIKHSIGEKRFNSEVALHAAQKSASSEVALHAAQESASIGVTTEEYGFFVDQYHAIAAAIASIIAERAKGAQAAGVSRFAELGTATATFSDLGGGR